MRRFARILLVAGLSAFLAGCHEAELYSGLSERDANEMLAVLKVADIDADKTTRDDKSWTLSAPKAAFPRAVAVLQARGYPKERFDSLGDVFKKQGLVSTPLEEHARLIYGLSQEIANTLSGIDGVVNARVLISIPEADSGGLPDARPPPSAAVFIKFDPEVDLTSQLGAIKTLVANSVEGVRYERVSVVLSPARPPPAPPAPARPSPPPVLAAGGAAALALGAGGVWLWSRRRLGPVRSAA